MKSLANRARMDYIATGKLQYSPSAKTAYKDEVESLDRKLRESEVNAPYERLAQRIANSKVEAKKEAYKRMDMTEKEMKEELRKDSQKALAAARVEVGAKRTPIDITPREMEVIQAGAISDSKLTRILKYADMDTVRQQVMPRAYNELSSSQQARISSLASYGYTNAEIAKAVGCSVSTVQKYL